MIQMKKPASGGTLIAGGKRYFTMKVTNYLTILYFFISVISTGTAQSLIIRGGLNLANANVRANGDNIDRNQLLTGIQAGLLGEIGSEMLSLEVGILYSEKGYNFDASNPLFQSEGSLNMNYLEVPFNGKVKIGTENEYMYLTAGPYFGMSIIGRTFNSPLGPDKDFKQFDFGLNFGWGVEISRFQFGGTYGLGLGNLLPEADKGDSFKHRVIQFHFGYRIVR